MLAAGGCIFVALLGVVIGIAAVRGLRAASSTGEVGTCSKLNGRRWLFETSGLNPAARSTVFSFRIVSILRGVGVGPGVMVAGDGLGNASWRDVVAL